MTLRSVTSHRLPVDARAVALLLHGYGSHEHDLVALASVLPDGVPWASLRAPVEVGPGGHAWFPLGEPGNPDQALVSVATEAIWQWVDAVLPATAKVVPIGFSQGGLMASQLLRTRPGRVLAPVMLGGFVQAGDQPGDAQLVTTRPVAFSGRGEDDRVIAAAAVARTESWLPAHTTPTARRYPDLGHGIDGRVLADVGAFLGEHATAMIA
ncbi:phospholipase [Microbacterium sp. NPDC089318]